MPSFEHLTAQTKCLTLRPFTHDDAPALFAIFSDPQVCRYLIKGWWTSIDEAHARIDRDIAGMASGDSLRFALERREDHAVVGECCLFAFHAESRRAEIGYALARAHWGRGYAAEGVGALVDLGFGELGLNRIEADLDPRNAASADTVKRLGFTKEGHLRERWIVRGEVSDTALYGITRADWLARRAG